MSKDEIQIVNRQNNQEAWQNWIDFSFFSKMKRFHFPAVILSETHILRFSKEVKYLSSNWTFKCFQFSTVCDVFQWGISHTYVFKAVTSITINLKIKAGRTGFSKSPSIPNISTNLQQPLLPMIELSTHATLIFKLHSL